MLTPFGKVLRKLRIDSNKSLKDMADYMSVSSAFLSAVESGKKKITGDIVEKSVSFFGGDQRLKAQLETAAWISATEYKFDVSDKNDITRETVAMFARNFAVLPDERIREIKKLLEE